MVFIGWVQHLINKKRSVRDFPAALAAKILRHPKRTQILKVFAELFPKKRPAGGTRPSHPPRPPHPDKSKFEILQAATKFGKTKQIFANLLTK